MALGHGAAPAPRHAPSHAVARCVAIPQRNSVAPGRIPRPWRRPRGVARGVARGDGVAASWHHSPNDLSRSPVSLPVPAPVLASCSYMGGRMHLPGSIARGRPLEPRRVRDLVPLTYGHRHRRRRSRIMPRILHPRSMPLRRLNHSSQSFRQSSGLSSAASREHQFRPARLRENEPGRSHGA